MSAVFLELFNRAVSAGWMILALLILRPVLQKIAAWVRCLLWGLAAVRLVLPIRIESAWSLVPSAETLSQNTVRYDAVPRLTSGIAALNSAVNERLMAPYFRSDAAVSMNPLHFWTEIAGLVWAAGCAALLSCATAGRAVLACPLAFGEVGVKERVKRVLNYKKPAFGSP